MGSMLRSFKVLGFFFFVVFLLRGEGGGGCAWWVLCWAAQAEGLSGSPTTGLGLTGCAREALRAANVSPAQPNPTQRDAQRAALVGCALFTN